MSNFFIYSNIMRIPPVTKAYIFLNLLSSTCPKVNVNYPFDTVVHPKSRT